MKKDINKIIFWAISLCLVIFVFSCSPEKNSYEKARSENTLSAYEHFLKQYPESKYENEIRSLIESIHFNQAKEKNSINAYIAFLKRYPNTNFASEVKELLEKKGTIVELTKKELVLIKGLSEGISDRFWLEYRGLLETESKDEYPKSGFRLWHMRKGFDSKIINVASINGKIGQVLGGTWKRKLLRKGQVLSYTEYDVYGQPKKTTPMPIETVFIKVKFSFISSSDSKAKVLLLPESKIVSKKK